MPGSSNPKRVQSVASALAALIICVSVLPGCKREESAPTTGGTASSNAPAASPAPAANGDKKYTPSASDGNIYGAIAFEGVAPESLPIDMGADPICLRINPDATTEEFVVSYAPERLRLSESSRTSSATLQNVFVYVKDGVTASGVRINDMTFTPPATAATLDQHGCVRVPHVMGIQTGQKLLIINSDPTTHNVNVQARKNESISLSQPPGTPPIERTFTHSELLIPFKCNQHPWEKAYVGVLRHPFYAVSGPDGAFEIRGLPPGTYALAAWHERLGEQVQTITIAPGEMKTGVAFTFRAAPAK